MSKLIVIEGTDCSGKETQSNLLVSKLQDNEVNALKLCFPMYNTSTGKIVGGPYLGKEYICPSWFSEGAANVDALTASLFFAADRRYNKNLIDNAINNGATVILDRYVESNMAHQGGKISDFTERHKMYKKLETIEYDVLELKKPDLVILLYVPYEYALKLKASRKEKADGHESSKEHLISAEKAYLELANLYNFRIVECVKDSQIRTIEDINEEVFDIVNEFLNKNDKKH